LLIEQRTKDRETAQKIAEAEAQTRDQNKEVREKIKQEVFNQLEQGRTEFKERM
jgi:hypothetical protein